MNCEWVKANGALYVYDELPDDARHEMDMHLQKCNACATDLAEVRALITVLSEPVEEPTPNLLAASRMRLQEELETVEQSRGWSRWTMDVAGWLHQVKFAPALAAVLLMIGFAGGAMTTFVTKKGGDSPTSTSNEQPTIASISGVTQTPGSDKVEIKYNKLVSDTAQGSVNDPAIQRLLLYAARSNYNSGVRLDSIDVLTQKPDDDRIREALIFALRYDKNPGVRLKALFGLKPYVKSDVRVRDVMLEALLRDSNSGIRTEAIRSLQPVTADSSVRATLQALAEQDSNQYIRAESRRVLASLPEID